MRTLTVIAAVSSISVLSGAMVLPLSAQDAGPAAPPNNAVSIPACAFQESVSGTDFTRFIVLYLNSGAESFYAPVNLPHGAKIRKVMLICWDDDAGYDITLYMFRINRTTAYFQLAEFSSNGNSTDPRIFSTTVISPRTVNNLKNSYFVAVTMPSTYVDGLSLSQVKILYDAP